MQKDDVIYRQAAIDALNNGAELLKRALDEMDIVGNEREKFTWGLGLIESCIDDLKELPSAQLERKKGKWKIKKATIHPYGNDVCCSICGHTMGSSFGYKFCPMCGADMRGESDD